jgi:hypothetical protein
MKKRSMISDFSFLDVNSLWSDPNVDNKLQFVKMAHQYYASVNNNTQPAWTEEEDDQSCILPDSYLFNSILIDRAEMDAYSRSIKFTHKQEASEEPNEAQTASSSKASSPMIVKKAASSSVMAVEDDDELRFASSITPVRQSSRPSSIFVPDLE